MVTFYEFTFVKYGKSHNLNVQQLLFEQSEQIQIPFKYKLLLHSEIVFAKICIWEQCEDNVQIDLSYNFKCKNSQSQTNLLSVIFFCFLFEWFMVESCSGHP